MLRGLVKSVRPPSVTVKHGITGIFLDPPYTDEAGRTDALYAQDSGSVAHAVREWALEMGKQPNARIALCGYEGEHSMPDAWECVEWKTKGGYGSQGDNQARENSAKERIWFSPYCLRQPRLFQFTELMGTTMADADADAERVLRGTQQRGIIYMTTPEAKE